MAALADETRSDPDALVRRVEELVERLDAIDDLAARETAERLLGAMMELYGEGLERILRALDGGGPAAAGVREAVVGDGVVASLLLIHGLYPIDLETRVRGALDEVRPYMRSHGGDVELVSLGDGVVRLRLEGSCDGCPSSAQTLELAIRRALEEAAPDLEGIEVEGLLAGRAGAPATVSRPLPLVGAGGGPSAWRAVDGLGELEPGERRALDLEGSRLLVANVEGTLLAYLDACAGCGSPLHEGALERGVLTCPSCGRGFELPRAGRALGSGAALQLTPVPLLADEGGRVTLAVAG
jgi:Fe-S cluster biogenesis protein NfuA/nitrite reductase/ring-hydroxylating ferredoxin subunit